MKLHLGFQFTNGFVNGFAFFSGFFHMLDGDFMIFWKKINFSSVVARTIAYQNDALAPLILHVFLVEISFLWFRLDDYAW